ncbi:MAG: hypothetical protein QG625_3622 [Cyanobacteriota bacterium erpe_2018_sw_39hr_WHONDRS-SW48-000098_B_bin.30]|nr:hypothetical protein [Cyanobacteriota bacterium erpe_2018_sw_39hr_WHONDRS-SW48-000098_B_bin.30]
MEPTALKSKNKPQLLAIVLLTTVVVLSFANTLTASFHCDDFFHTDFLYRAFGDRPGRLLSIFYTPWLNDTSFICFYRPLTEVSLAIDYLLYQGLAAGYHATNIILHLINCFVACQLFKRLLKLFINLDSGTTNFYALAATLVFACLPTHSEAVAWILSRSDLASTLFYLVALYCFSFVIESKSKIHTLGASIALVLALLCKEAAISLPFVMLALALFCGALKKTLIPLVTQFAISAIYLVWRTVVLGTFYGGYSGSLGELMATGLLNRWFASEVLFQIFHPFNEHLISPTSPLRIIYRGLYIVFAILIMLSVRFDQTIKAKVRLISFLLLWSLLSLLPSLQIVGVTNLMSGGRVEYLPAVGAALALTLAISTIRPQPVKAGLIARFVSIAATAAFIVASMVTVQKNNLSWQLAGEMINSLQSQIKEQVATLDNEQKLVLFNVPSQVHGAFTFTNDLTFRGMVAKPLLDDTAGRVVALDFRPLISPTINLGDVKAALANPAKYRLVYFDQKDFRLKPFVPTTGNTKSLSYVTEQKTSTDQGPVVEYYYSAGGDLSPIDCEILQVKIKIDSPDRDKKVKVFIDYNDRGKDYDDYSSWFEVKADGQTHTIAYPMAAHKRWLLVKHIKTIKLTVACDPDKATLIAPEVSILTAGTVTPLLTSSEPGMLRGQWQGGWHLPAITYDASGVSGASGVLLQLARPNFYFEHYSGAAGDSVPERILAASKTKDTTTGDISTDEAILKQLAKADGVYQLRAGAVDGQGKVIGAFSQPVTIDCRTCTKHGEY